MVFEPALTRNDWLGLVALAVLLVMLLVFAMALLSAASRRSKPVFASVLLVATLCGFGVGKLVADRLRSFCAIEFTDREAIVRGVASTVRLPLTGRAEVDLHHDSVRLVSGGLSATLPGSAQWAADNLVVDADYLAHEFAGRAR
jgi:hypothetical protein